MDPKVAPLGMLPMGLALALMDDPASLRALSQLSPTRQHRVIAAARRAHSPEELRRLLDGLDSR